MFRREEIRFLAVGGAAWAAYWVVVAFLVSVAGMEPVAAAALGYILCVIGSYIAHRTITFRSMQRVERELPRFLVTHVVGVAASALAMYIATDVFRLPYVVGTAAGSVLVPAISFVLMRAWVFRTAAPGRGGP